MPSTTVVRTIAAPAERVFDVVADISSYSMAIPGITKVEFLSDVRSGVGTRFRETRRMGKREVTTELEVTEYERPSRVRIVSDTHGTVWDTVFTTRDVGGRTELRMVMDARAYKLLPKLMNPLVMKMISKAVAGDMDAVKSFCEQRRDA